MGDSGSQSSKEGMGQGTNIVGDFNSRLMSSVSPQRREHWHRSWKRFASEPLAVIGLVIVSSIVLIAILAPWLAPYPEAAGKYTNFAHALEPPSLQYPLGTDWIGRDVLSRIMFGFRFSLTIAAGVLGISVPFGITLGLVSGYYGGIVETIGMRTTDTFISLPPLVMALAVASVLGPNLINAMIALTMIWWTWHTRLVHGVVTSERTEEYVEAARISGLSTPTILFREILPNILSPILVKVTLDAGFVILMGAGLSFLGVGVQPPNPGLGTMVSKGTEYLPGSWWVSMFPGFAILILVMGFNMIGDGLRDMFDVEVQ